MSKNIFDDEEPLIPTPANGSIRGHWRNNSNWAQSLKRGLLIFLPIILAVLAGSYFFFNVINSSKNYDTSTQQQEKKLDAVINKEAELASKLVYLDIDPMLINLIPTNDKASYLKIAITLQLSSKQEYDIINSKVPVIMDVLQGFLRELRASDFLGSGANFYIKEEISKRINKTISPLVAKDVLIKDMLVN